MFLDLWKTITRQKEIDELNVQLNSKIEQIKGLNDLLYNASKDKVELAKKIKTLELEKENLIDEINIRDSNIESLKFALAEADVEIPTTTPEFINQSANPYMPMFAVPDTDENVRVFDPKSIYVPTDRDKQELEIIKRSNKVEKLKFIWKKIVDPANLIYKYDGRENWQSPYHTRFRKKGDCEDGTIWFVSMCRAAGISSKEVFNAVGPTSFGYHSFPIVYLTEEESIQLGSTNGSGWYIFESTLDWLPASPLKLIGSKYWVDGGIANWRYAGMILTTHIGEFNGYTTRSGGNELMDNSEEKIRKLRDYWKVMVGK